MNKKNFFIYFLSVFSLSFVLIVNITSAQSLVNATYVEGGVEKPCDCNVATNDLRAECKKYCTGNYQLNDILNTLVSWMTMVFGIIGSLALLMFVFGGFTWILAAGNAEKISKGKSIMVNALLGIVIIFTSYMIIQFALTALGYEKLNTWNVISGS